MKERPYAVSVPADSRYLKVIRSFFQPLVEELYDGKQAGMIILALDESCANVIKHRSQHLAGGSVQVRASIGPDRLLFRIGDFCGEEDVPRIRPRDLEDVRPGGLGTHFISQIMDRVAFEPEEDCPGRVALVLEKRIPGGGDSDDV